MTGTETHELTRTADIDRVIAVHANLGLYHRVHLLRAARDGRINIVESPRDRIIPTRFLKHQTRPLCVILGDDDYETTGPTGWVTLPKLLRWARAAMIHATGGDIAS